MYNFIYNPIAGKGRAQRFRAEIEPQLKARGVSFRFWETTAPRDAVRIAEELTVRGETDIVVMGGDGTVNEVLNGLDDPSKVRLGLIPCGSGNDFAAAIGIPRTPEGSLDKILNGEAKPTDYLVCSGVRGLNAVSYTHLSRFRRQSPDAVHYGIDRQGLRRQRAFRRRTEVL